MLYIYIYIYIYTHTHTHTHTRIYNFNVRPIIYAATLHIEPTYLRHAVYTRFYITWCELHENGAILPKYVRVSIELYDYVYCVFVCIWLVVFFFFDGTTVQCGPSPH